MNATGINQRNAENNIIHSRNGSVTEFGGNTNRILEVNGPIIMYSPSNLGKIVSLNNIARPLNKAPNANPAKTITEKMKCNPNAVVRSSLNNPIPNNPIDAVRRDISPKNA